MRLIELLHCNPTRLVAKTILLLSLLAVAMVGAPAQQHIADAPTLLEGPQTPGTPPPAPPPALPTDADGTSAPTGASMTNETVLKMHHAGLGEELILQTIATQPGTYRTDAESLIALKQAGLSDAVLAAMTGKARRQITGNTAVQPATPTIALAEVNEIGVYYKNKEGRWTYIDPELIHIQGGGFVKSTLTNGIIKPDKNGAVAGRESKLLLPRPIEFLIYAPEGVAASEYELLRFRLNSKNREFRVLTGGVIHSHGGAERDDVAFTPVKQAPRAWTFTVKQDTPGGEYGILPPGTGNVTNGGKIYTFAISE